MADDNVSDEQKIQAALDYIASYPQGGATNYELTEVKNRLTGDFNYDFEPVELVLPENDGTQPESQTPEEADPDSTPPAEEEQPPAPEEPAPAPAA